MISLDRKAFFDRPTSADVVHRGVGNTYRGKKKPISYVDWGA
jgi:hypothetical protein